MFFERYLSSLLNSKFGSALDGLDPRNVKLSLWKGCIEYQNLSLKPNFVNDFLRRKRPREATGSSFNEIALEFGHVGTLIVQIPWSVLGTISDSSRRADLQDEDVEDGMKCSVVVRDVSILLTNLLHEPKQTEFTEDESFDDSANKTSWTKEDLEREIERLISLGVQQEWFSMVEAEVMQNNDKNAAAPNNLALSWKDLYIKRVLTNLFTNLVVSVQNVHIRYQHDASLMGFRPSEQNRSRSFAMGARLHDFTLFTVEKIDNDAKKPPASNAKLQPLIDRTHTSPQDRLPESKVLISNKMLDQSDNRVNKCACIKQFSIYWDSECGVSSRGWMKFSEATESKHKNFTPISAFFKTHAEDTKNIRYKTAASYYQAKFASFIENEHEHFYVLHPFGFSLDVSITNPLADLPKSNSEARKTMKSSFDQIKLENPVLETIPCGNDRNGSEPNVNFISCNNKSMKASNTITLAVRQCQFSISRDTISDFTLLMHLSKYEQIDIRGSSHQNSKRTEACFKSERPHTKTKTEICNIDWMNEARHEKQWDFLRRQLFFRAHTRPHGRPSKANHNLHLWWKYFLGMLPAHSCALHQSWINNRSITCSTSTYRCSKPTDKWLRLVYLLKLRVKYIYLFSRWQSGFLDEDYSALLSSLESDICLSLQQVAFWRLYAEMFTRNQSYRTNTTKRADLTKNNLELDQKTVYGCESDGWAGYSKNVAVDTLTRILRWKRSNISKPDTLHENIENDETSNENLTVDEIVSNIIIPEIVAENVTNSNLPISEKVDSPTYPAKWLLSLDLTSLQLTCMDSISLTMMPPERIGTSVVTKRTQIPILNVSSSLRCEYVLTATGGSQISLCIDEMDVFDLTSGLESGENNYPRLFGLASRQNCTPVEKLYPHHRTRSVSEKGMEFILKIIPSDKTVDKEQRVIDLYAVVSTTEFNYRIHPLEAFSRMLASLRAENKDMEEDIYRMKDAVKQFSVKQKAKIKQLLINTPHDPMPLGSDDVNVQTKQAISEDPVTDGDDIACHGGSALLLVDIRICSPVVRISKQTHVGNEKEMWSCIILNLGMITLKHGSKDDISESTGKAWSLAISNSFINLNGKPVLHPCSVSATISCSHDPSLAIEQKKVVVHSKTVLIDAQVESFTFVLTSSFKRLVTMIIQEWKCSRRYWNRREETQKLSQNKKIKTERETHHSLPPNSARYPHNSEHDHNLSTPIKKRSLNQEPSTTHRMLGRSKSLDEVFLQRSCLVSTQVAISLKTAQLHVIDDRNFSCLNLSTETTNEVGIAFVNISELAFVAQKSECGKWFWNCSLNNFEVEDLYQQFYENLFSGSSKMQQRCFLLRSVLPPSATSVKENRVELHKPLLSLRFVPALSQSIQIENVEYPENRLSIVFSRPLLLHWNPETIARLQATIKESNSKPTAFQNREIQNTEIMRENESQGDIDSDEEFFDAFEDDMDINIIIPTDPSKNQLESRCDKNDSVVTQPLTSTLTVVSIDFLSTSFQFVKPPNDFLPYSSAFVDMQTDEVKVIYVAKPAGGMRLSCEIQNFTITDSCGNRGRKKKGCRVVEQDGGYNTLYGQIFGSSRLRNQNKGSTADDFFSLNYESFPRDKSGTESQYLSISREEIWEDSPKYTVSGFDSTVSLHLPKDLRIVYIHQLWMELLDYFFEGIVASEVLVGKARCTVPDPLSKALEQTLSQRSGSSLLPETAYMNLDVHAEDTCIILPIAYQSPQHLKLSCESLILSNVFSGEAINISSLPGREWLQWFNAVNLKLHNLSLSNWRDHLIMKGANPDKIILDINARWPVGATAPLFLPKWNINVALSNSLPSHDIASGITISLQKEDLGLIQHILSNNIGEPSRNFGAWKSWKTTTNSSVLPLSRVNQKFRIVNFGYDLKDSTPSTYEVRIFIPTISLNLIRSGLIVNTVVKEDIIAKVQCIGFCLRMTKLSDIQGLMKVSMNTFRLMSSVDKSHSCDQRIQLNSFGLFDLIIPILLKSEVNARASRESLVLYSSSSNQHGDSVKKIHLSSDYVVDLSYPKYFLQLKNFFTELPAPEFWTDSQILGSMQVGDRWYMIDHREVGIRHEKSSTMPSTTVDQLFPPQVTDEYQDISLIYQLHLHLECLLVLGYLSAEGDRQCKNVALKTDVNYVYEKESVMRSTKSGTHKLISRSLSHSLSAKNINFYSNFVLESKETYATSLPLRPSDELHLLIKGWCCIMQIKITEKFESLLQEREFLADVLQANISFSDISVILGVTISFLKHASINGQSENKADIADNQFTNKDQIRYFSAYDAFMCRGISVLLVDDSLRHFSSTRDLVNLDFGAFEYYFSTENIQESNCDSQIKKQSLLQLASFRVLDKLQPDSSNFRHLVNTADVKGELRYPSTKSSGFPDILSYKLGNNYLKYTGGWIYDTSLSGLVPFPEEWRHNLDDLFHRDEKNFVRGRSSQKDSNSVLAELAVQPISLEWNPGTVVALQRFLGRSYKQYRLSSCLGCELDSTSVSSKDPKLSSTCDQHVVQQSRPQPIKITLNLKQISMNLNKENQSRRLVDASIEGLSLSFSQDSLGRIDVKGSLEDIIVHDSQANLLSKGMSYCNSKMIYAADKLGPSIRNETSRLAGEECFIVPIEALLSFRFQKSHHQVNEAFSEEHRTLGNQSFVDLPPWVAKRAGPITDFLTVSLRSLVFVYLAERTAELIDYLSNGLPGRGMGKTAEAAKCLLDSRIQTRSAMSIRIEAPIIRLPKNVIAITGINVRIGDLLIESWFEERTMNSALALGAKNEDNAQTRDSIRAGGILHSTEAKSKSPKLNSPTKQEPKDWWRCLSVSVLNMGYSSETLKSKDGFVLSSQMLNGSNINLYLIVRRPLWYNTTTVIRAALSDVETKLNYSDWALFWSVYKENIGAKIDESKWDTATVDEIDIENELFESASKQNPTSVTYAEDARIIRYGKKKGDTKFFVEDFEEQACNSEMNQTTNSTLRLDFKFELGALDLTFHRNDDSGEIRFIGPYDSSRVRIRGLDSTLKTTITGDHSIQISLTKLDWTDLGANERIKRNVLQPNFNFPVFGRNRTSEPLELRPAAFWVIAEGYQNVEHDSSPNSNMDETTTPQIIISVEKQATGILTARLIVNFLSVNALVKPIVETFQFLSCTWPLAQCEPDRILHEGAAYQNKCNSSSFTTTPSPETHMLNTAPAVVNSQHLATEVKSVGGYNLKLVLHYPRIFLLADESDISSKALVLRGLTTIEYGVLHEDISHRFFMDAHYEGIRPSSWRDFQSFFSLNVQLHSVESYINPNVGNTLQTCHNLKRRITDSSSKLGVALIEPVTASLSISRTQRFLFPLMQQVSLNMEPVSLMLSFGDISLIERLLKRWSGEREKMNLDDKRLMIEASEATVSTPNSISNEIHVESYDTLDRRLTLFSTASWDSNTSLLDHEFSHKSFIQAEEKDVSNVREYVVKFHSARLGLVLRKARGLIVVDDVQFSDVSAQIGTGDILKAIGEEAITPTMPFQAVIKKLERYHRPVLLTFERTKPSERFMTVPYQNIEASSTQSSGIYRDTPARLPSPLSPHEHLFYGDKVSSILSMASGESESGVEVPYVPEENKVMNEVSENFEAIQPVDLYTITFVHGESSGIQFEAGLCGGTSVVIGLKETLYASATRRHKGKFGDDNSGWGWLEGSNQNIGESHTSTVSESTEPYESDAFALKTLPHVRIPRPGAVLIAVNGVSSAGKKHKDNMETLNQLAGYLSSCTNCYIESNFKAGHKSSQLNSECLTYQLTFLEAASSEWKVLDSIDSAIEGVSVTIIDDINGKDMPLLRGSIEYVELFAERGLGLATSMIDVPPPSILLCNHPNPADNSPSSYTQVKGKSTLANDSSELITKVRVSGFLGVEYYNARIALWEPLLEPFGLSIQLEKQPVNSNIVPSRPGHLSVLASDSGSQQSKPKIFWKTHKGTSSLSKNATDRTSDCICINVTDAAAEMLIRTANEWRRWREIVENDIGLTIQNSDETTEGSSSGIVDFEAPSDMVKNPKTANEAVHAALKFASKKKKESSGTGSNPFVIRNRTGVSIAFVCQNETDKTNETNGLVNGGICGFDGLSEYSGNAIQIVENETEVRFCIEEGLGGANISHSTLRVRTYDRKHPCLQIALENSVGKVLPLRDLPVVKTGQCFRPLKVLRDSSEYTILLLWTVELENNRRILTLSGSISVEYFGCGTPIEVGVKSSSFLPENLTKRGLNDIVSVGKAMSGRPCYLPIWIGWCERASVFLRPDSRGKFTSEKHEYLNEHNSPIFDWSSDAVLSRGDIEIPRNDKNTIKWVTKKDHAFNCDLQLDCPSRDNDTPPACLSCVVESEGLDKYSSSVFLDEYARDDGGDESGDRNASYELEESSLIVIRVSSFMTIRNLLPVKLEWEVFACGKWGDGVMHHIDGSLRRSIQQKKYGTVPFSEQEKISSGEQNQLGLSSGQGAEVFSFDFASTTALTRFRVNGCGDEWTEWAKMAFPPLTEKELKQIQKEFKDDERIRKDFKKETLYRTRHTLTVLCRDGSGAPLRIGIKLQAKNSVSTYYDTALPTGFDVTIFAELWIKNLTQLPLVIGAPLSQVCAQDTVLGRENSSNSMEIASKLAAETALMEIVSVLELGDGGRNINVHDDLTKLTGELFILPLQESDTVFEEVFEYIEVEHSCVKRRWWASERHDCLRKRPTLIGLPNTKEWQWEADDSEVGWWLDSSGGVIIEGGGWESCKSLFSNSDNFSYGRRFDPRHRYRRRRWSRKRLRRRDLYENGTCAIMFHQSDLQRRIRPESGLNSNPEDQEIDVNQENDLLTFLDVATLGKNEKNPLRIAVKIGDGRWSAPVLIPSGGNCNGIMRVTSARWPKLCERQLKNLQKSGGTVVSSQSRNFRQACLNPALYEVCYSVTTLNGSWGEVSRVLTLAPRYVIRNESLIYSLDVKQYGAKDESALRLFVGESKEWYWPDFRLPELVVIRPVVGDGFRNHRNSEFCSAWEFNDCFKWSGPIDICKLGMTSIRIRKNPTPIKSFEVSESSFETKDMQSSLDLRTIRAHVEIRPGTGASGVKISLKDENSNGSGALFRIENNSPFPLWVCQNDLLVNAMSSGSKILPEISSEQTSLNTRVFDTEKRLKPLDSQHAIHGDLILPMHSVSFGLDAPFRQGKYGRIVPDKDLLLVRVALAPIHSRDGIESTKVIGMTAVGSVVRLGPSKLRDNLDEEIITNLLGVRVLGVVCADGPTRVARFCLMEKEVTAGNALGDVMRRHAKHGENYLEKVADETGIRQPPHSEYISNLSFNDWMDSEACQMIRSAAVKVCEMKRHLQLPTEAEAEYQALLSREVLGNQSLLKVDNKSPQKGTKFSEVHSSTIAHDNLSDNESDHIFSFKASFGGLLLSFVDSEPSEIAVACLREVQAAANWNAQRTEDALAGIRVGWLQVDNHCPSASFPVAIFPDLRSREAIRSPSSYNTEQQSPFLTVQMSFAPKHSSGIACLRSMIVKPRDLAIAVDLAFLARLQRFLLGIQEHMDICIKQDQDFSLVGYQTWAFSDSKEQWPLPDLDSIFASPLKAESTNSGKEIYFEGLTIFPCNLTLSIAPAKALTVAQATHEGPEAAAIHAAVRKGDLLVSGGGQGVLGVKVGGKNNTAIQVIRGIFKNILFDALLRCESAGLNFPGVALRNYFASTSQLRTYLVTHYITALRNNVPAVLGSLAAFGNPVGLIRDLGDGVSDFVSEPIKGLKKSMQELNPTHVVDGVAKGTGSLARHAVGGIADSASMITETFSKNMAVLTLDRRYAQRRDQNSERRRDGGFVEGVGSGGIKLVKGVFEGVTGVVRAPIRGAERNGVEGFAKGVGKGLIGLVVKPVIGISDAATEVMIGVKGSMLEPSSSGTLRTTPEVQQLRCRRALYGEDRAINLYKKSDARAAFLMSKTKLAADQYLGHCMIGYRIALFSTRRFAVLQENGKAKNVLKYRDVKNVEVRQMAKDDKILWSCVITLASATNDPAARFPTQAATRYSPNNMVQYETVVCPDSASAQELCKLVKKGVDLERTRKRIEQVVRANRKEPLPHITE